jgi:predicted nucleic-acid-binding protein
MSSPSYLRKKSYIALTKFGGVQFRGIRVNEELLTEGMTLTQRIIPLSRYSESSEIVANVIPELVNREFKAVSKDDTVYSYQGLYAKPDVILESHDGLHLVVEIKSRLLTEDLDMIDLDLLGEDDPRIFKDILQVMISAWVYSKSENISTEKILPMLRYKNFLCALSWSNEVNSKINFYSQLYHAWKDNTSKEARPTISATELAKLISVLDKEYKATREDQHALSSLKGELIHLIAIHGQNIQSIRNSLQQQKI